MRFHVFGQCPSAAVLRAYLENPKIGYVVDNDRGFDFKITLYKTVDKSIFFDSIDSDLERNILNCVTELTPAAVTIQRQGGIQSEREILIGIPEGQEEAVERGVLRGILITTNHGDYRGEKKSVWKKILAAFSVLLLATSLHAQSQVTVQQADGTRLHMTCDSGCSGSPGSTTTTINDPTITTQKLAVDSAGKIGINNFPATQPVSIASMPSTPVTGTFWQSTQPVSLASMPVTPAKPDGTVWTLSGTSANVNVTNTVPVSWSGQTVTATQATGTNLHVVVDSAPATAVTGTFWQSIQPVSWSGQSVTVNTISGFALETGGNLASVKTNTDKIPALGQALASASVPVVLTAAQLTTLTPLSSVTVTQGTGTNLHTVVDSGAVTATLAAETTKVIGTVNIAAAQTVGLAAGSAVIGHVINDSGSTTVVTGNVTVVQPTGSNLHVVVDTAPSTAVTGPLTDTQLRASAVPTSLASLPALAAGSALIGKVGIDQTTPGTTNAVEVVPSTDTAVGLSSFSKATVTTSSNVKASAGNVYGVFFLNGAGAGCWLELINNASTGTLGTGVISNIPLATSGTQWLLFNPPIGGFTSGIAVGAASAVGGASACGTAVTGITILYK